MPGQPPPSASAAGFSWIAYPTGMSDRPQFIPGQKYSRFDVMKILGVEQKLGGNWFTGYHRHEGEWFLFPTVGDSGRTGHDYPNRWVGDKFEWYAKNGMRAHTPAIRSMVSPEATVHLFTRADSRDAFTYQGQVTAQQVFDEPTARIIWMLQRGGIELMPEEIDHVHTVVEGTKIQVVVNAYERDRSARSRCIAHWGSRCQVCDMSFSERYGDLGEGFIHVHHLTPISMIGESYSLDPIEDLRPVCANCHAMLHRQDPPLSIEHLRAVVGNAHD
jgi:5-methylcytosine-specific restriction protein A